MQRSFHENYQWSKLVGKTFYLVFSLLSLSLSLSLSLYIYIYIYIYIYTFNSFFDEKREPLQYNATLVDDVKVDNIFKVDDGSGNLRSSIKFS